MAHYGDPRPPDYVDGCGRPVWVDALDVDGFDYRPPRSGPDRYGVPAGEGCTCHACGARYRVDLMVPAETWEAIRPARSTPGGGLLCGSCIAERLERLGGFDFWMLGKDAP